MTTVPNSRYALRQRLRPHLDRRLAKDQKVRLEAIPEYVPDINDKRKTPYMRMLERTFNKPMEVLLYEDKIAVLANKFGVDPSAISHWRRRLKGTLEAPK